MRARAVTLAVVAVLAASAYRNRSAMSLDPNHVACLGDSLTYGSTWNGAAYVRVSSPYPAKVAADLPTRTVDNHGVGGDYTSAMLTRWTSTVRPSDAGVLCLWGGINDILNDVPAATITGNLAAVVSEAVADGRSVLLFTLAPWKAWSAASHPWTQARQDATDAVNGWIRSQATSQVRVIETYSSALNDGGGYLASPYASGDGLHFSQAGYDFVALLVESAIGTLGAVSVPFTYRPAVLSVSPATADTNGLVQRTIHGAGFTGATGVTFGGVAATSVVVASDTTITCVVPAHAAGAVDVIVTAGGIAGTGAGIFRYRVALQIASITPSFGPMAGGTPITVAGVGIEAPASLVFLSDGSTASDVAVVNATTVTAKAPSRSPGMTGVKLISGDLSATLDNAFMSLTRIDGSIGASGTISAGMGLTFTSPTDEFRGVTSVLVGGVPATDVVVSSDGKTLSLIVPQVPLGALDIVAVKTLPPGGLELFALDVPAKYGAATFEAGRVLGKRVVEALQRSAIQTLQGDCYIEIDYANGSDGADDSWPGLFTVQGAAGAAWSAYVDRLAYWEPPPVRHSEGGYDPGGAPSEEYLATNVPQGRVRYEKRRLKPPDPRYDANYPLDEIRTFVNDVEFPASPMFLYAPKFSGPWGFDAASTYGTLTLGWSGSDQGEMNGAIYSFKMGALDERQMLLGTFRTRAVKPIVRYRTFRSDDLTKPLFGPVKLEIETIAMKREGASFEAKAPSLSLNRTGETYDLDRFPMLRGAL